MAGRMLKWSLKLSELDIQYKSRKSLKAQVLADYVAEMTLVDVPTKETKACAIFIDGASISKGRGAGIILENKEGIIVKVSQIMSFMISNNMAEYKALQPNFTLPRTQVLGK